MTTRAECGYRRSGDQHGREDHSESGDRHDVSNLRVSEMKLAEIQRHERHKAAIDRNARRN